MGYARATAVPSATYDGIRTEMEVLVADRGPSLLPPVVVVHGGAGSPAEWSDRCVPASREAVRILLAGGDALAAAVAAVRVLEDDGRFNAGRGSVLRLDGRTVETDASVMDSTGRLGAVAALRGFRHPIDVALAVASTPHVLLTGEGAARFAAARGLERREGVPSPEARERHRRSIEALAAGKPSRRAWRSADVAALWNFEDALPDALRPHDTVGAVVRDAQGRFAAANSTGGAVPMLLGRVGDSPIPGAGIWAGPAGAVVATGTGEEIIRRLASFRAYERLAAGAPPDDALAAVLALFDEGDGFGACAVSATGHATRSNRSMAVAVATP
jgi:L-asparaginase/beta-aspartyl-peptidase (threonine type)